LASGGFRRAIHVVDWTKHRRRKAAAKCHLRLDLQSFLPRFAILDTARDADAKRAREVCAGLKAGEIVIFDKAYVDFSHLFDLFRRGIWWVSWAKDNLQYRVVIKAKKAKPVKKGKENESGCQSQEGSVDESSMG
jgi:hypothetical protein